MIKTIGLLMAVSLTPAYSTLYSAYGDGVPSPLDEADGGLYYVSYSLASTGDYGGFMVNTWDIANPKPYPLDYVCELDIDELNVYDYYASISCNITFNPEIVSRFGACSLVLKYGDTPIVASTFAVSLFNFGTEQFGFGYNVRTNNDWTNNVTYRGYSIDFFTEKYDIEQNSFYLYFYAYQKDVNFIKEDAYNDGYDDGYRVGLAAGHSGALFNFDWIINAVGGFLDTKIFGTFGIGDLFTIFLGVFLMIYLLKVFAGG